MSFAANTGYILKAVYLNTNDVTAQLKSDILTIDDIPFDMKVSAVFVRKPFWITGSNPNTGDSDILYYALLCCIISLTSLVLVVYKLNKQNIKKQGT